MLRYANVKAVYILAGYPVCDIFDQVNGAVYTGCRFLCAGGGSDESTSYDPPSIGARVVYGLLDGNTQAIVFGSVFAPNANRRITDNPAEVSYDQEYPGQIGVRDKFWERGNSWMFLTDDGQFVFDASQSDMPIRFQLSSGKSGNVRISQDEEAEENVLLAGPTRDYLDQLRSDLDSTRASLVKALVQLDALNVAASGQPKYVADIAEMSIPGTPTDDSVVASAIRISSRSVAEDVI